MAKAKKAKAKPKAKGKKSADMWPVTRQYMERPERLPYLRKMIPNEGCVFCKAADRGVGFERLVLYSGELAMAVLNKFPYNTGHLLILPKRHTPDLVDLSEEENQAVSQLIQASVKIIRSAYNCDGLNLGMNLGATAGAGIPGHLHWHIVPRWSGDTNFFPLIAQTKCLPETLQQSFDKLYPHFKELR